MIWLHHVFDYLWFYHVYGLGVFWFLVSCLFAGWLAGRIMRSSGFGLVKNLVVGVLGAVLGRLTLSLIGIYTYSFLGRIVAAVAGSMGLIYVVRMGRRAGWLADESDK